MPAEQAPQLSLILAGTDNVWAWAGKIPAARHWRTTQDVFNSFGNILFNLDSQERVPEMEAFAGRALGYNDLDMLHVGWNYGGPGLPAAQAQSSLALLALLKSPMLLSCAAANLTQWELDLLRNEEMLAVHQDALGAQAKRLGFNGAGQTGLGLSQQHCSPVAPASPASLAAAPSIHPQQAWRVVTAGSKAQTQGLVQLQAVDQLGAARGGEAVALCATASNCAAASNADIVLCPCSPAAGAAGAARTGYPSYCSNATCQGTDRLWRPVPANQTSRRLLQSAVAVAAPATAPAESLCLEGVMGPGPSSAHLRACDATNENQAWLLPAAGAAGMVQAAESRCLTADPAPNPTRYAADVYGAPLTDGTVAALVLNRAGGGGNLSLSFSLNDTLPLFPAQRRAPGLRVSVWDVWHKASLGEFVVQGGSVPLQLQPYGSAFLRLRPVNTSTSAPYA